MPPSARTPSRKTRLRAPTSGVFSTKETRWILADAPPALLTLGIDAAALGETAERLEIRAAASYAEIDRLVLRHRGAIGIVARNQRGLTPKEQVCELRKYSRRVPILLVGTSERDWLPYYDSVWACSSARELPALAARLTSRWEESATRVHAGIDRYAALVRLTPSEADLVFRFAMGIRQECLHSAQGISTDTRKERLSCIRSKAGVNTLREIEEAALKAPD